MPEPRYRYADLGGDRVVTRAEVLRDYFAWWSDQMRAHGKADQISEDACLEDWMVVHWAWKIEEPE